MTVATLRVTRGADIDETRPLRFQFQGISYSGYSGDTLASALLANGVRLVGRSFKFHRPRGVFTCGLEEPNALVQLGVGATAVPSTRATLAPLHEGLIATVPGTWPSLRWDVARALDAVAPLWAAGFYNKTFKWPSWHWYEETIRRVAGFGEAPSEADPDRYAVQNLHCEVLVVGGGLAGLQAAVDAATKGQRVVLVEHHPRLGGRAAWDGSSIDGEPAERRVRALADRLAQLPEVRVLCRTDAVGHYERDVVTLVERSATDAQGRVAWREKYWIVRAARVILATGAIEQPLIFCNNDRPGILLAGAAHQYLRRFGVAAGRRVLIATNNDSAYPLALDLKAAGIEVLAMVDSRPTVPAALSEALKRMAVPLIVRAIPTNTRGFSTLSRVTIGHLTQDSKSVRQVQHVACDALAVSGGWSPALHLYSQAGGTLRYHEDSGSLQPIGTHPSVTLAGLAAPERTGPRLSPVGATDRQWLDLRHDVTVADLELAVREGFSAIEHVKRYTTVGMSVDQGKTSHLAAIDVLARLQGVSPAELGHTKLRPPFVPVTLGAMAGRSIGEHFMPARRLPLHDWHRDHAASLEEYGDWTRPACYRAAGESRESAIEREARIVRRSVGLFDGSSLGKIEIHGPDALEFVDRFYINSLRSLQPGRVRYGLMLRENGVLFDDGTIVQLSDGRVLLTTTSGNASRVAGWLDEWHQCEWPELKVAIVPVTDAWAVISLAGPAARQTLSCLATDIALDNAAFPHLSLREGTLLGHPARVYRVSFSGELTYEINIPSRAAREVWEALLEAGMPESIAPFGLEALMRLRLEKGFLHLGADTDGTTIPDDVGWGQAASRKRADFIGKRSLTLPEHRREDRLQLVGLRSEEALTVGSHLRIPGSREPTHGWITSAGRTVLEGEPIALALLQRGRALTGSEVTVHDESRVSRARVVHPVFYDPAGDRMNG